MNISESGWAPTTNPGGNRATDALGREDFLRLLITQIAQQDPLNPADSSEFLAQLAEFSGLEQMMSMNAKLDSLAMAEAAANSTGVAALIGHSVTAAGDGLELGEQGGVEMGFELPAAVEEMTVTITDEDGQVVRTMKLGGRDAGAASVTWDGLDDSGQRMPAGSYAFSVQGTDADGNPVDAVEHTSGVVTGISFDKGYPELLIGERRIALGDVIEII